jgi:hypothetical protein
MSYLLFVNLLLQVFGNALHRRPRNLVIVSMSSFPSFFISAIVKVSSSAISYFSSAYTSSVIGLGEVSNRSVGLRITCFLLGWKEVHAVYFCIF